MKFLSRLLSMLLSFQLLWSCNGTEYWNIKEDAQDVVEIHGEIAKIFMKMSNLIIPTAMAEEKIEVAKKMAAPVKAKTLVIPEGLITVYDMTDPNDPVELHSENLVGPSYNIKIARKAIENKIIKISYESYDSDDLSRDQLIELQKPLKSIAQNLSEEETLKSRVAEEQLKIELNAERIKLEESKQMLAKINAASIEDFMGAIDDKDVMIQLLLNSKDVNQKVSHYVALYRIGMNTGDKESIQKAKDNILRIAKDLGLIDESNIYFDSYNKMADFDPSFYKDFKEAEADLVKIRDVSIDDAITMMKKDGISEKDALWEETIILFKEDFSSRLKSTDMYFNGGAKAMIKG